ncbi:MAG: Fe-S cluster assembly protein SufB [Spirochaetia bacterium]|nr:Fe-S cluster assembly protein SufB [Spirochaetota bacterium]MDW8112271.1 Fe-S cluster assembly protein SufB [Spirochaetia bacterium]
MAREEIKQMDINLSKYDFKDPELYVYKSQKGISEEVVKQISKMKGEPDWMTEFRVKAYRIFEKKAMPTWGERWLLDQINFDEIYYYVRPTDTKGNSWDEVPEYIKKTFDRLGIPEAERKYLAGVTAQYESEVVYHSVKSQWESKGVIFTDMDTAVREYPDIVKRYFGTVVPPNDNKFASLNSAVWSGGSFVYVPKGVHVDIPLQAYFRINTQNMGQFERTLIIAEEGASVHYIEGCTAPMYSTNSLHAAVVEIIAHKGAYVRYTTVQNWSKNIYNLVTKRAFAYEDARVEWVDGNLGSKLTMKYPAVFMLGKGAQAEILSIALAGAGQVQDAGAKVVHAAPYTSSKITNKSISIGGGKTIYRGLVKVMKGAVGSKNHTSCNALLIDELSKSDTIPHIDISEDKVSLGHEATAGRISEEQLFYLMSRGLNEHEALVTIVNGFIEPFTKALPLEYAVELNRLIELELEDSIDVGARKVKY